MNLVVQTVVKPLIVGAILTLVPLTAQGPKHDRGPGQHMGPFGGLNLTEDQKTQIKAIADKHKAAFETKRKAAQEAQAAFFKAMQDPSTKDADLKTLHTKVSEATFAELLEHRAMMQENLGILTADQKAQWEKQKNERPGFRPPHEGRGPRHGGPDGPFPGDPMMHGGPMDDGPMHDGLPPEGPAKP